jgi:hypothetical protein
MTSRRIEFSLQVRYIFFRIRFEAQDKMPAVFVANRRDGVDFRFIGHP